MALAVSAVLLFLYKKMWLIGLLAWAFPLALSSGKDETKKEVFLVLSAVSFVPPAALFALPWFLDLAGIHGRPSIAWLIPWALCFAAGLYAGWWWLRAGIHRYEAWAATRTKKSGLERNKKTDVRTINETLPAQIAHFTPESYFDPARCVFIGLDEAGQPLFIEKSMYPKTPHMFVAGASGGGKGVVLGVLAAQWLRMKEAVFFIDPKNDEWGPHVMAQAAEQAGTPYHFINLREPIPQFSLFAGASADEIEELLIVGFGLGETGTNADFYSIADRQAAQIAARELAAGVTPAELYRREGENYAETAAKFAGKLRELGDVSAVNAPPGTGLDLAGFIEGGGACYVVGSMRHERIVRVQKMLLVRLIQIAEARDRIEGESLRPVGIILDELKYHLSKSAIEALGAARDKGVHVCMAFQSLNDLRDVRGDLSPEAVIGAVIDNAKIKISFRAESPETADWLAEFSGTVLVDDETRTVQRNAALADSVDAERTIRQSERHLIDANMLKNLHTGTSTHAGLAVVYGLGLARFAFVSPIRALKRPENVLPEPAGACVEVVPKTALEKPAEPPQQSANTKPAAASTAPGEDPLKRLMRFLD